MPQAFNGEMAREVGHGVVATSLIFAASVYLPVVGFFSSLFIPLPILFYRSKLGRRAGAVVAGVSGTVVMIVFGGPTLDMLLFGELILLGFALGEQIERNVSIEKTLVYACSAALGTAVVVIVLAGSVTGKGVTALVADYVARNLKLTLALYENMGMPADSIETITRSLDQLQYVLVRIIPAMSVASCLFVAWACLLVARPMLQRRSLPYPDFGPLTDWKAPEFLVWGVIVCGLLLLVPEPGIKMIGLNGLLVLVTIYFFQGIAIVAHFFERKHVPRPFRVAFYGLLALQQLLLLLVIGLGFFDMWANFRKLGKEENS